MNGELVRVNNHRLYIEAHGPIDGVPVVLLHHGLGAVKAWKGQIQPFADAGYRIITYDRWGYGGSDPRDHLSLPYFEEDLSDLEVMLDSLNVEQVALVGHSDGGTISLYFAAQNPTRVTCMVITAAHIYVEAKMIPGIHSIHQAFTHDARMRAGLQRLHGDKVDSVFQGWYQGWLQPEHINWDMRPILSRIACPTLVVQGMEDDHATPKHAQDIAAEIPNADLWLKLGAGHMLPQDIPEEFNKRVMRFLEIHHVQ